MARRLARVLCWLTVGACTSTEPPREYEIEVWTKASEYCIKETFTPPGGPPPIWSQIGSVEVGIGVAENIGAGRVELISRPVCAPVVASGEEVTGIDVTFAIANLVPAIPTPPADRAYRLIGGAYASEDCSVETMTVCAVSDAFGPVPDEHWEPDPVWAWLLCVSDPADTCPATNCEDDGRVCVDSQCVDSSADVFEGLEFWFTLCHAARANARFPD